MAGLMECIENNCYLFDMILNIFHNRFHLCMCEARLSYELKNTDKNIKAVV